MGLNEEERGKMLEAHSIGPVMVNYLERIGIESLADLANADARELALRINVELGKRHINATGVRALENLIEHARSQGMKCRP